MPATSFLWPYPPSVNALYRRNPNGRGMYKTPKWEQWHSDVAYFMFEQKADFLTFDGPVRVSYIVARPDKRKRDVTNLIKVLDDMLEDLGIVDNDCQIVDCRIRWDQEGAVSGGLIVTVEAA